MSDEKIDFLDLNQENVLSIYKDCLVPKEDRGKNPQDEHKVKIFTKESCGKDSPEETFYSNKILTQSYNIAHLLGQLKVSHDGNTAFTLPMGFINYKNEPWTKDNGTLMALYYLGIASNFMPIFKKMPNSNQIMSTAVYIVPTFSIKDPNYAPTNKDAASLDDDQ